jgi:3'-5' exoribonuclease Rv2179c-like domain
MGQTRNVFFDTEFTTINPMAKPFLISIGCVAEDGSREFYAELTDTWTIDQCSSFVRATVLPLLEGTPDVQMTEIELAAKLKDWIEGLGAEEVILRSDAPDYDWQFIERIFKMHGWPSNLCQKCSTVSSHLHRYNVGKMYFWKDNEARQHHALVDARCVQFAWKFDIDKVNVYGEQNFRI